MVRRTAFMSLLFVSGSPVLLRAQDTTAIAVLPAVTVNVLRTTLGLAHVPVSKEMLGPERTQGRGAGLAVAEVLQGLAGVQADDRHNQALGERLSIRGFGARSTFGIRGVRVLVDGIPATMPDGQTTLNHVDPAQIMGAELIRGAAGAFLGNAAGGALQLRTGAGADPGLEASAGADGLARFRASAAGAHASAYGSWQRQDGYRSYSAAARGILGAVGSWPTASGHFEGAFHAVRYDAENPGSLTAAQANADPGQANPNNVRQRTAERGTHAQAGAGWQQVVRGVALEVRGYGGVRDVFNPIPPRIIELTRTFGGVRTQAGGTTGRHQWATGAEVELQADDRRNFVNAEGRRGDLVLDQRERVRGAALFAQAGWSPVPAVQLFAAGRRDADRFVVADRLITPDNPDDSGSRTLRATSFSVGAGVHVTGGWEVFGDFGTAFETPTTTELANRPDGAGGFNPALQPERTNGGEAGVRARQRQWSAEATLFRADVRDKLIPFEVPVMPGRQFFRNAGRARHQGLELTSTVQPWPVLELRAAYTRLDVRFRRYLVDGSDLAGRRVPGVAGHRLEAESRLDFRGRTQLLLHVLRNGRVMADDANDASADPYTLCGLRLTNRGLAASPWRLAWYAGVENALGEDYTAAVSVNAAGARYYEPGPGRTWYAGLTISPGPRTNAGTPAGR